VFLISWPCGVSYRVVQIQKTIFLIIAISCNRQYFIKTLIEWYSNLRPYAHDTSTLAHVSGYWVFRPCYVNIDYQIKMVCLIYAAKRFGLRIHYVFFNLNRCKVHVCRLCTDYSIVYYLIETFNYRAQIWKRLISAAQIYVAFSSCNKIMYN
jgi:hypothetical protein